jgi:hypothetical protein
MGVASKVGLFIGRFAQTSRRPLTDFTGCLVQGGERRPTGLS